MTLASSHSSKVNSLIRFSFCSLVKVAKCSDMAQVSKAVVWLSYYPSSSLPSSIPEFSGSFLHSLPSFDVFL